MLYKISEYVIDLTKIQAIGGIFKCSVKIKDVYAFYVYIDSDSIFINCYDKAIIEKEYEDLLKAWWRVKGEKQYNFQIDEIKAKDMYSNE